MPQVPIVYFLRSREMHGSYKNIFSALCSWRCLGPVCMVVALRSVVGQSPIYDLECCLHPSFTLTYCLVNSLDKVSCASLCASRVRQYTGTGFVMPFPSRSSSLYKFHGAHCQLSVAPYAVARQTLISFSQACCDSYFIIIVESHVANGLGKPGRARSILEFSMSLSHCPPVSS